MPIEAASLNPPSSLEDNWVMVPVAVQPKSAMSKIYDSFSDKISRAQIGQTAVSLTSRGASTMAQRAVEFYAPILISNFALHSLAQGIGGVAAFGVVGPLLGPVVATSLGIAAGYGVSYAVNKIGNAILPAKPQAAPAA